MAAETTTRTGFSDEELIELLGLIKDSDTVELKLTVPESHQRSTVVALGMDPLEAQIRQVFFFDTPELALNEHGVVVRARRIQGKGDDSVVKLRPVVPAELPADAARVGRLRGRGRRDAGRLRLLGQAEGGDRPGRRARAPSPASGPLRKLFSKEQRKLFAAHAPEGIGLDDLSILGPIFVLKLRFTPEELGRRLVAEMWLYPDGSRAARALDQVRPAEAFEIAAELRAFLAAAGVDLSGEQETKTRKALQYFARALREGRTAGAPAARERVDRPPLGVADVRRAASARPTTASARSPRARARRATRSTCSRARATRTRSRSATG